MQKMPSATLGDQIAILPPQRSPQPAPDARVSRVRKYGDHSAWLDLGGAILEYESQTEGICSVWRGYVRVVE
jgi:hypothetical protein